jgi:hypothetical protein
MTEISCAECVQLGPELALNALSGETRERVVNHLDMCPRCRATIAAFTDTSDRLLELMPERPPPPGFEARVLAGLRTGAPPSRRWTLLTAALAIAVALIGSGWLLGRAAPAADPEDDTQPGTRSVLYAPVTGGPGQLGQAFLYPDRPAWMFLSAPRAGAATTVRCQAIRPDQRAVPLGSYALSTNRGWQLQTPIPEHAVVVATLYDGRGDVVGSARFPPVPSD